MTCLEACEKAQDFADGRLGPLMRARIRLHLLFCRDCSAFLDQTRKTARLVRNGLAAQQSTGVDPKLMAEFKKMKE
ncbi:MAG: anti-sigma factor family protein [Paracoccaceae bacterium]